MRTILVLAAFLIAHSTLKADVVYDNLYTSNGLFEPFAGAPGTTAAAQQFKVNQSFFGFDQIRLNLYTNGSSPPGTFSIKLFSNSSNLPGSQIGADLASGNWESLGTTKDYQFIINNVSISTQASGTYWLVVQDNNPSNQHNWSLGETRPYPDNTNALRSALFNGSAWNVSGSGTNKPFGAFISVSVPEPGTLLLAGFAALSGGTGLFLKRRRKS